MDDDDGALIREEFYAASQATSQVLFRAVNMLRIPYLLPKTGTEARHAFADRGRMHRHVLFAAERRENAAFHRSQCSGAI